MDNRNILTKGVYFTVNLNLKYKRANKLQKTHSSDFTCKKDFLNNWNNSKSQVYQTKGKYKL